VTSKPTGPEAQPEETPGATPSGGDATSPLTGALDLPPTGAVDHTDRQNLMDTQTTVPRRPADGHPALTETPPTVEESPVPASTAPPAAGEAEPADEGDVSEPDAGWFQSTQPPPSARSDAPGEERGVDPVMYLLAAVAVAVVLVIGGFALFG
jgi:hypothetical protein